MHYKYKNTEQGNEREKRCTSQSVPNNLSDPSDRLTQVKNSCIKSTFINAGSIKVCPIK